MTREGAETRREPRDHVAGTGEPEGTFPDRYWNHEEARWSTVRVTVEREEPTDVPETGVGATRLPAEPDQQAAHGGIRANAGQGEDIRESQVEMNEDEAATVRTDALHGHAGGDAVLGEAFWEEMYRSRTAAWSGRPNPQLVTETADLPPGTALDVGCGEGADAVWLAQRGWQVTAIDISPTALRRARANEAEAGPEVADRITWLRVDLTADVEVTAGVDVTADVDLTAGADLTADVEVTADRAPEHDHGDTAADQRGTTYDLVTAQFMHLPSMQLRTVHARLAASVSPGGTLLVVGHHPSDIQADVGRGSVPDLMYTADQVADTLDPHVWEVLVSEARPRQVTNDKGEQRTAHDTVLTARRR
jgi:SAM-dependent methyltransferase